MKQEQLEAEVRELLRRAQEADEEEEGRRYGKGRRGEELPKELSFAQQVIVVCEVTSAPADKD